MKRKKSCKKLNNKGFSLVEVLIAVFILAIVTGPILSCFVTSIRINAKSKEQQRQNAAAQSIMEGFKAYDMDSLIKQFDGSSQFKVYNVGTVKDSNGTDVSSIDGFNLSVPGTNWNGAALADGSIPSYNIKSGEFYLQGLNYQGTKYDARVTVSLYDNNGYNGTSEITYIENMNGFQDCVYIQQPDEIPASYYSVLTKVAAELNKKYEDAGYAPVDGGYKPELLNMNYIKIKRNTNVTINDTVVKINTKYIAEVDHYPYTLPGGSHTLTTNVEISKTEDYFNNSDTGADLENIFLFIYPAYSSSLSGNPIIEDKYSIVNTASQTKQVFFVKQRTSTITELSTCENTYSPSISVNNVSFYHNLAENLAGGITTGAATFETLGSSKILDGIAYERGQALVYKVVVDIYAEGSYGTDGAGFSSATPLYTLEGTMNDN